jgi:hypothetical protein
MSNSLVPLSTPLFSFTPVTLGNVSPLQTVTVPVKLRNRDTVARKVLVRVRDEDFESLSLTTTSEPHAKVEKNKNKMITNKELRL